MSGHYSLVSQTDDVTAELWCPAALSDVDNSNSATAGAGGLSRAPTTGREPRSHSRGRLESGYANAVSSSGPHVYAPRLSVFPLDAQKSSPLPTVADPAAAPEACAARQNGSPRPPGGVLLAEPRPAWQLPAVGVAVLLAINLGIWVSGPTFKSPKTSKLQSWQPYLVLNGVIGSIALLAMGLPADLLLLGLSSAFCALRIITCDELLGGLSNEGVVAVAALCAVSAAIDKTKALNGLMGRCMGKPKTTAMAMLRLAFPLLSLGSVFNNTPLVAVMIPIVKDWTERIGLDVGHFMMPLSFFAMLSATLTTMGSSTNLLAVQLVPEANIGFLDPAPVGLMIIATGVTYCALVGPHMLPRAFPETAASCLDELEGIDAETTSCAMDDEESPSCKAALVGDASEKPENGVGEVTGDRYTARYKLDKKGPLVGQSAIISGLLLALPAPTVVRCTVGDGSRPFDGEERIVVENATAEEIISFASIPGLRLQAYEAQRRPPNERVSAWGRVKALTVVTRFLGAARSGSARRSPFSAENFKSRIDAVGRLAMPVRRWVAAGMGGGWDEPSASLFKLVVPPGGLHQRCAVSIADLQQQLADFDCTLVAMSGALPTHNGDVTLLGGEVLLVEAYAAKFLKAAQKTFPLVVSVPEQPVPLYIKLSPLDPFRPYLAVLGLLVTVLFSALEWAPLDAVAILVALASLLLGTLTGRDFYRSINGPVLLTVAASFGVGAAIYNTGLATCLASGVLFLAEDSGNMGIVSALVVLALSLGIFVSNNTVVVLLAPLIKDICERKGLSLKVCMLSIIYAANLSFATPFSYQTNMMVMEHGRYVFMDYVKFGVPMMILCGITALCGTFMYWGC